MSFQMDKIKVPQNFDYSRYPGGTSTIRFQDFILRRLSKPSLEINNPTLGVELEGEQKAARDDVVDWVIHPDVDDRVLSIGGYAGCGKTTLACHIQVYIKTLGLRCNVTSLTGKAVEVLRKKGIDRPETIHSCLYTKDDCESKKAGRLIFTKNQFLDYEIIVIDEAQILSKQYYEDFLSFPHIRLIAIGDHGQLQAIGGDTIDLMKNPRIRLEETRRQALGSNILQFAHALRNGKNIKYGKCPGVMIAPKNTFWKDLADPSFDQIIVGFNRTRHEVNRVVRKGRGFHGDIPNVGERVICLYNNRDIGVFNGQTFIVNNVHPVGDELLSMVLDDNGVIYTVIAVRDQFGRDKIDLSYSNRFFIKGYRDVVFLDFAYGITAHKSMGSEYGKGKVLEEVHRDTDVRRWSYTAATRFIDEVQYFR
jgi:exodeoxyribonuclease-5